MSHPDVAGPAGQADPVEPVVSAVSTGQTALAERPEGTTGEGVPLSGDSLRVWLAGALSTACDGELSAQEILRSDSSFVAMGITSIATIRLVDAIEAELDIMIDFGGDTWFLQDLDALTTYLTDLTRP
ncbi:phosphopantetheine-binding protein [Streptosporangium sp. NPDC002524]|uniref:phosphopantetheine-binding protein n=1 Tax=Streptosporangium sp. NPDC002524 TaxID=3154537 RepID=UPI00332DF8E6